MTKVVLQKPTSGFNLAAINDNFIKLEDELNNKILYRNNPEGEPNQLRTDVDVNSVRLYNLREPLSPSEAARLQDVTNAISGASAANLISFTPVGTIASTNVQAAIAEMLAELPTLASNTPVTTSYSNFTMNAATPNNRVEFMSTNPSGFNTDVGKLTVDYEFISNAYFQYNPGGHVATVLRQDPATPSTQVTGNGVIMGDLTWSGFNGDEALYEPVMMIETWDPTRTASQRYIFPDTTTPRNKLLVDGARYKVSVESTKHYNGAKYIRYRLWKYSGSSTKYWELINDSGSVLDHNGGADFSKQGFMFGVVTPENLGVWSIDFSNVKGTWGPPEAIVTDGSGFLNKFGADVRGDLTFVGVNRKIRILSSGSTLTDWTAFQNSTLNGNTTVLAVPNGSGNSANFFAASNPSLSTFSSASFGIVGANGVLETFSVGSADPPLKINIGVGVTVATFKTTGLNILGATYEVGRSIGYSSGLTNFAGSNVSTFATTATIDWDSTSAVGYISGFLGASYNQTLLEYAIRPLYCTLGYLIADLKNKKVI